MKITDIITEDEERSLKKVGSIPIVDAPARGLPDIRKNKNTDELGMGIQTKAGLHKSGKVVKYTTLNTLRDPLLKFINICMFNADNPWLPTYEKAKIYKYGQNNFRLVTTSKMLQGSLNNWQDDHRLNFLNNIKLSKVGQEELEKHVENTMTSLKNPKVKAGWIVSLLTRASPMELKKLQYFVDDDNLLQAVKILQQFKAYDMDMHDGNFMWDGAQLVINDPVFNDDPDVPRTKQDDDDSAARKHVKDKLNSDDKFHLESLIRSWVHAIKMAVDYGDEDDQIHMDMNDRIEDHDGNYELFKEYIQGKEGQDIEGWVQQQIDKYRN